MSNPFSAAAPVIDEDINHFFFIVDESSSMSRHRQALVKQFDALVSHLALRSKEFGQETRVTVYLFNSRGTARCVVWDKDVLRMPSIEGFYQPKGLTALIDTTMLGIADMRLITQKYGRHGFCLFAFTDGEENQGGLPSQLSQAILTAPDNETYAAFVPNPVAVAYAKKCGFPAGNIQLWDTTSSMGFEQVGETLRNVSDRYMEARSQGIQGFSARSGGGLFKIGGFSAADVRASLTPVTPGSFFFLDVRLSDRDPGSEGAQIDRFFERRTQRAYPRNRCYYQLLPNKSVKVQDYKDVAVEVDGVLYSGTLEQVRSFVGLPDVAASVRGDMLKPGTYVFIQSSSMNRKLFPGTRLLVFR